MRSAPWPWQTASSLIQRIPPLVSASSISSFTPTAVGLRAVLHHRPAILRLLRLSHLCQQAHQRPSHKWLSRYSPLSPVKYRYLASGKAFLEALVHCLVVAAYSKAFLVRLVCLVVAVYHRFVSSVR